MSHFSINKSVWLGVLLFLTTGMLFAQPTNPKPIPNICVNTNPPPAGYTQGSDISFSNVFKCIPNGSSSVNVFVQEQYKPNPANYLSSVKFYFDADQNFSFSNPNTPAVPATYIAGQANSSHVYTAGWYWIIMEGQDASGNKKYKCRETEVFANTPPKISLASCGPNSVTLTIPNDPINVYDKYTIDWGNTFLQEVSPNTNQPLPITINRTYPSGTIPTISIKGNYIRPGDNNVCPTTEFNLPPPSNTKPIITELNGENQGTEATIKFDNYEAGKNYNISGYIDDGTGSGTPVMKNMAVGKNGTATITGLSAANRYCFFTESTDGCGTPVTSENILCSIKLTPNLVSTSEVNLVWNLPSLLGIPTPSNLKLYKDIEGCNNCQVTPVLPNLTSYNDNTLVCSDIYLYAVEAKYRISFNLVPKTIIVRSAQMKVDPTDLPAPPIPNNLMRVSYDPNNEDIIQLIIKTDAPAAKYQFFRAEGNSADFIPVGTSLTNTFDDVSIINTDVQYCYKFQAEDACGNASAASPPFCSILLNSKQPGTLNWTAFTLPPSVPDNVISTTYGVEYFDPGFGGFTQPYTTDKLVQSIQSEINNSNNVEVRFRITSTQTIDKGTLLNIPVVSHSNVFTFTVPPRVYAPTAFTPDGAGPSSSEKFKVFTKFVASGKITVYDNWGSVMFSSDDLTEEWDGKIEGRDMPAPTGTYAYKIVGVSTAGKDFTFKGSILLLR